MHIITGLVAVNTTILSYAALIVAGGAAIGLVLYFLATQPQSRYSQQYSNNQYYSSSRMFNDHGVSASSFDLMGLVSTALEVYKKLNEEDEDWVFQFLLSPMSELLYNC